VAPSFRFGQVTGIVATRLLWPSHPYDKKGRMDGAPSIVESIHPNVTGLSWLHLLLERGPADR
jgi:hypothetical protein